MQLQNNRWTTILLMVTLIAATGYHCSTSRQAPEQEPMQVIQTNAAGKGIEIQLTFQKGESHNHPLLVVWIEDTAGNYIETLYVAESIGKGIFQHADRSKGSWQAGPIRRPAALPYWGHKRGIQAPDGYYLPTPENPMPDAITGPTPPGNFQLNSSTSRFLSPPFVVLMEINQSWDWNEYWTNNKFPGDEQYKSSSQPSVIYAATLSDVSAGKTYDMTPMGHGHYSGENGLLYPDLGTLTTALDIVRSAVVTVAGE